MSNYQATTKTMRLAPNSSKIRLVLLSPFIIGGIDSTTPLASYITG